MSIICISLLATSGSQETNSDNGIAHNNYIHTGRTICHKFNKSENIVRNHILDDVLYERNCSSVKQTVDGLTGQLRVQQIPTY